METEWRLGLDVKWRVGSVGRYRSVGLEGVADKERRERGQGEGDSDSARGHTTTLELTRGNIRGTEARALRGARQEARRTNA
jgi:hypothetical protein